MKISNLYGKKIVSEDKKKNGVIMAISCVNGAIEGYICFDENEKEFFALSQGVRVLKDKATFKHLGEESKKSFRLRLGIPAFTQEGKYLGNVSDFSVIGGRLCATYIGNKKYPADNLFVSDAVIIKPPAQKMQAEIAAKDMFIGVLCGS